MSVTTLHTTTINIYSVTNTKDNYGSLRTSYTIKHSNVSARICYQAGVESVNNGKEIIVPTFLIMIGDIIDIDETDAIMDTFDSSRYDIISVNSCYGRHREVLAKRVDQIIPDIS